LQIIGRPVLCAITEYAQKEVHIRTVLTFALPSPSPNIAEALPIYSCKSNSCPAVSRLPDTLNILIAPEEMLHALNGNPHLQQFRILFVAGIRSGVLNRLDRELIVELHVRRAFTAVRAVDHPRGESPLIPDSGASVARKGQGYGGPYCPGHEAGLSGASSCTPPLEAAVVLS
jgi:hypothetical protein